MSGALAAGALLLPWWIGCVVIVLLAGKRIRLQPELVLGTGYLAGIALTYAIVFVQAGFGHPLHVPWLWLLVAGALLTALAWWRGNLQLLVRPRLSELARPNVEQASIGIACALVFITAGLALFDTALRPVFPWDAWYLYDARAYLIAHYRELLQLAGGWEWVTIEDPARFTFTERHPQTGSLLAAWPALAMGEWNESWIHLGWPLALLAIFWTVAGFARQAGYARSIAAWAGLLAVTMPITVTQATLTGYIDLWMGCFLVGGAALLLAGIRQRAWGLLLGGVLLLLAAAVTKSTGALYALAILIAAGIASLPPRAALAVFVVVLAGAIGSYLLLNALAEMDATVEILGITLGVENGRLRIPLLPGHFKRIYSHDNPIPELSRNFFLEVHLHLIPWLLVPVIVAALIGIHKHPENSAFLSWLAMAAFLIIAAYAFTREGRTLDIHTVQIRVFMTLLLPSAVFALFAWRHQTGVSRVTSSPD